MCIKKAQIAAAKERLQKHAHPHCSRFIYVEIGIMGSMQYIISRSSASKVVAKDLKSELGSHNIWCTHILVQ